MPKLDFWGRYAISLTNVGQDRPDGCLQSLRDGENDVFVSAATAWEIAIKRALGRLEFPLERFTSMMATLGFKILPILATHAIAAGGLPHHHGDPFDRILVGQAIVDGLILVTNDARLHQYDVNILGQQ